MGLAVSGLVGLVMVESDGVGLSLAGSGLNETVSSFLKVTVGVGNTERKSQIEESELEKNIVIHMIVRPLKCVHIKTQQRKTGDKNAVMSHFYNGADTEQLMDARSPLMIEESKGSLAPTLMINYI